MKTKILRVGFWLLLGVAISTGFVACGSKDDNPQDQCSGQFCNNAFGVPGGQVQVVTDDMGIVLQGGSPPSTVYGTVWILGPMGNIPVVFNSVGPGQAVSDGQQRLTISSFTTDASYNSRVAGTIVLCREYLSYDYNQPYNSGGCTPVSSGFNAQLRYDPYMMTVSGRLL